VECIIRAASYMKGEQFSHEREVRLIGRARGGRAVVHFRTKAGVIVPYIEIKHLAEGVYRSLPIVGFNLGFGIDFELAKVGLEMVLRYSGYEGIALPISNQAGTRR